MTLKIARFVIFAVNHSSFVILFLKFISPDVNRGFFVYKLKILMGKVKGEKVLSAS